MSADPTEHQLGHAVCARRGVEARGAARYIAAAAVAAYVHVDHVVLLLRLQVPCR